MDTLKTKTAKPNHVVFYFISILTSTWYRIYSKVYRVLLEKNVSINILLWNGRTHLMNNSHQLPEI